MNNAINEVTRLLKSEGYLKLTKVHIRNLIKKYTVALNKQRRMKEKLLKNYGHKEPYISSALLYIGVYKNIISDLEKILADL